MRDGTIIGLCGWPKSGKNAVAEIIARRYGAVIVDDGLVLRTAAPFLFHGIDVEDCLTQEGKDKIVDVNGKPYTVRALLGFVGDILEQKFGEHYVPDQTVKHIARMQPAPYYVLTSVRKTQGQFYRQHSGSIFQIDRDEAGPSPYAFDRWNRDAVNWVIDNNSSFEALEDEVQRTMHAEFGDAGFARLLAK